ncbi:site-2 protease family protein [Desulfothermus okinawensis JCM 13304]
MHSELSIIQEILIYFVPVLIAITFHEVAHGYTAYVLGDPTAKRAGRLSLNPIKHLDPIGAIALLIVKVGWAKPVPINPLYFKKPRRDLFLVSFAGPFSNFLLAIVFSIIIKGILFVFGGIHDPGYVHLFSILIDILSAGVIVNIGLGIFNLIPIPPLDGSNMVIAVLPRDMAISYGKIGRYGIIIIFILFLTGIVQKAILPILYFLVSILLPG